MVPMTLSFRSVIAIRHAGLRRLFLVFDQSEGSTPEKRGGLPEPLRREQR